MGGVPSSEVEEKTASAGKEAEKQSGNINEAFHSGSNTGVTKKIRNNQTRESRSAAQPIAKKQPIEKKKINYEDIIADDENTNKETKQNNKAAKSHKEEAIVEVHEPKPAKKERSRFVPPPPIENGDIVPMFPVEETGKGKSIDQKKNSGKGRSRSTRGELEYLEGEVTFSDEDSSVMTSSTRLNNRTGRRYSESTDSTFSDAEESTTKSKTTEKTLVPSDSDDDGARMTSRVYVVPDAQPGESNFTKTIDVRHAEDTPPADSVYVYHMFEKSRRGTKPSVGAAKKNDSVYIIKETNIALKNSNAVRQDVANRKSRAVRQNANDASDDESKHVLNLQLYPGVECYKTVIKIDENTEDVSHLRDVFLKDAILSEI